MNVVPGPLRMSIGEHVQLGKIADRLCTGSYVCCSSSRYTQQIYYST